MSQDAKQLAGKVGMVIQPVEDLEAAARFYREGLGLEEAFRDGDRFCAFQLGGVMIALAAGEERLTEETAVSYKVSDCAEAVRRLEASGARRVRGPEEGPHEIRAVLEDPAGRPLIVYASKSS